MAAVLGAGGVASTGLAQPCDGLVAHWAMNGNVADSSGNGHNGTLIGGSFLPGLAEQCLSLGTGGTYAQFANAASLNPTTAITVAGWYFAGVTFTGSGNEPIVDKGYTSHSTPFYQYHLGVGGNGAPANSGAFRFAAAVRGQFVQASASGAWEIGNWYHVAGTYDGISVRIYVNGTQRGATPATGLISVYNRPVNIGKYTNLAGTLPGKVDEVRIYNRALSPSELMVLTRNPAGFPLVEPPAMTLCQNQSAVLTVAAVGVGPFTYQWRKDGAPMDTIANPSAATSTLAFVADAAASYDCIVTNACGSLTSSPANITLASRCSIADIAGTDGGTIVCGDSVVDGSDFIAFINSFSTGDVVIDPLADIAGGGGDGFIADGIIDGSDFIAFINAFAAGC